jgi:solute carrier family 13 (sodium-dependent dicarboxylate transporter), member 2/3/5
MAMPLSFGMDMATQRCAAIVLWIAAWWIMEPVHTSVTALLPLVLFPLLGVMRVEEVSAEYGDKIIFLFIAGFFFGKVIEHWGLHRRIALWVLTTIGGRSERLVLGFILATALISMWVSNTATALMMMPVAAAVATGIQQVNLQKSIILGVGYASSIGGLGTMIGTPTNAIAISYIEKNMGVHVSFGQWLLIGFPLMLLLVTACWLLLIKIFPVEESAVNTASARRQQESLNAELKALGPMNSPQKRFLWLFGAVVLAWVSGSLFWYKWLPSCNDTVVAMTGAILMFLMPSGNISQERNAATRHTLLTWPVAVTIPWGIVVLFGGGLALAKGIEKSGLATWLGMQLQVLSTLPTWMVVPVVLAFVVLLSEVASNIATAAMMMPVLAAMCAGMGIESQGVLLGATMAASFGFGLPVAAAANSIAFGTGYLRSRDMMRVGFLLDLVAVFLLSVFVWGIFPLVF